MATQRCVHCRAPIQSVNFALGKEWMHYDPASSFPTTSNGGLWQFCRQKIATPAPVADPDDTKDGQR